MTHPIELLADEVDGTLGPDDRAALHDHLRSCASCRDDVRLAAAARQALRSMPAVDAPDIAAGFTPERMAALAAPAPRATSAVDDTATGPRSPWSRLVPALAAAAVVGAVALVLPGVLRSSEQTDRAGAPAAEAAIEETDLRMDATDYDAAALERLATSLVATIGADMGSASAPSGAEAAAEPDTAANDETVDAARRAAACLQQAFPDVTGPFVQVRRAAYEGEPAFLGVVVEGTEPAVVTIHVAAIGGCTGLAVASQTG